MSLQSDARQQFYGPYPHGGVPVAGTTEVQVLALAGSPSGGTFRLRLGTKSVRSAPIAYNATAVAVQAALEALPVIGTGGVTCSGGPLHVSPVAVTFAGGNLRRDMPPLTLVENALTGGTNPTVTTVINTAGVDATARGVLPGALLIDTVNKQLYQNEGSAAAPIWAKRGGTAIVEAHASDDTLLATENGSWHTNQGAAGPVTITLPPAVPGLEFRFGVAAGFVLRIDPAGAETISFPETGVAGGAGKYLVSATVGASLHVHCAVAGTWGVVGFTGSWSAEP